MNEQDFLKALADFDRDREAPPAVEERLRSAFRRKYRTRVWPYAAAFAIAAAVTVVLFLNAHSKPQTMQIAVVTPPVAVVPTPKPPKVVVYRKSVPKEVVTEFYPLLDVAPPFERGELLRVSLPASAMQSVGLPVSEDHRGDFVQADVLVGEEGLARAIRFVRYER